MTRLGDRAYRLILSVFPRQFRRRYGVDMIEQFSRQRRGVRGRPLAAVSLWCRAGADALGHGLALRLAGSRAPSGTAPAGSSRVSLRRGIPRRIELQQALRALRRSPWYSLTVVAVITLSTALSATVFAIVDGVLFKPLPYADAGNLYRASARRGVRGGGVFKLDELTAWRDAIPELQFTAIQLRRDGGTLGDGRMYGAVSVDENFFSVLGHAPLAGGFTLDHFRPGGTPVAIISYRLWHRVFAGSRDAIGRVLPLVGAGDQVGRPVPPPVVVGILPRDFVFPDFSNEVADVIRPLALPAAARSGRNDSAAQALVRLPSDMPIAHLQARLDAAVRAVQPTGETEERVLDGVSLRSFTELASPFARSFQRLALLAASLIALACLGVAGLSAARARQRERDVVLRRALGATGWDLFRQSIIEAAPPVFLGSALGFTLAPVLLEFTLSLVPLQTAFLKTPQIDPRVGAVTAALAAVTTLVVALGVMRTSRRSRLTASGSTSTTARVRGFTRMIVAGQAGLAFALTLGGALVVTSLWYVWQIDPGYDSGSIAIVQVSARAQDSRTVSGQALEMNAELAKLPGVTAAGVFGARLLQHGYFVATVRLHPGDDPIEMQQVPHGGDLLDVLELRPIRGRLPTSDEIARRDPVVLFSERAVASLWPGEEAVGRSVFVSDVRRLVTVIGVVPDVQFASLDDRPRAAGQVYTAELGYRQMSFLLRTSGPPAAIAATARAELVGRRDQFDVLWSGTMVDALGTSIANRRFAAWTYGGFAVSALAITAVGILGLVAMVASLRTREIAVRLALGADTRQVVRLILKEQIVAVAIGLVAGGGVAAWSAAALSREVYGVTTSNPVIWAATALIILAMATVGTLIPAIRVSVMDPIRSLRSE